MAMLIRAERVSYPRGEKFVMARSWYASCSSGSEHDGDQDTASSSCLSDLINGFFEPDDVTAVSSDDNDQFLDSNDEDDFRNVSRAAHVLETLRLLLNPYNQIDHALRLRLYSQVIKISEELAWLRSTNKSAHRRAVMAQLRALGYNAGICKAKWEASGGLVAGSYEYIDIAVVNHDRYIIDLDFASEFEIARPTDEYLRLLRVVPRAMIVKPDELRQAVRIMAEGARRSLKSEGLSVPPWRKSRHMIAKWLGPYRRTVNILSSLPPSGGGVGAAEVKCRAIGFKAAPTASINFF